MDVLVKGIITEVLPEQSGVSQRTGNTWRRAQYKLEHEHGQYPKSFVFEVMGDELINKLNIRQGDEITVHLNLECHEFNGKLYNDIRCWAVDRATQHVQQPTAPQPTAPQPQVQQPQVQQPIAGQAPLPPQGQSQTQVPLPFQ